MSTFRVVLVERLGPPDPAWPSVFGPAAGADPIAANGLRTLDLTPSLSPLQDFSVTLERDLTKSAFGSLNLDLVDADGSLADSIGPTSLTMGTGTRYYGPWVQVFEDWGSPTISALRFLGYLDETSIETSEDQAETKATALHATQLIRERFLTDFPELLRPYPQVPTTATESFAASNADDILHAAVATYTQRVTKVALETALWASGQISWVAGVEASRDCQKIGSRSVCTSSTVAPPLPPSLSIIIGASSFLVDHIEWDTTLSKDVPYGPGSPVDGDLYGTYTYGVARVVLQGAPDLTGILSPGTTVSWAVAEETRTHYLLAADIPAPTGGSDGQRFIPLNTVEQLVPGDVLTFTYQDTTSGQQRLTSTDMPPIVDLDGETGKAWLYQPLSQAYTTTSVSKVRRNSQDPVLFDGLAYAKAVLAPFTLDTAYFQPAATLVPVPCWRPYDAAVPQLYGAHNIQTIALDGTLQLARRGADNGTGAFTVAGVWQGSWDAGWMWQAMPTASATHDVYGDAFQFPGSAAPFQPPVIYTAGDLSGGATIPKNGWRNPWRTWKGLTDQIQDIESYWDGTSINWGGHAAANYIPAKLVCYSASSASPGRYTRASSGPTWTFEAHTADRTLGSSTTPSITGSPAGGNWIALGMGIYADPTVGHTEALLSLSMSTTTGPWAAATATLFSIGASGALTVRQTPALSVPTAGPWAIGGGLVVCTWNETRGGATYPRTRLFLVDGRTMPLQADFPTLEIIPGTIQPLQLAGSGASAAISGWYCQALETFEDANYHMSRRLRFLWLGPDLVAKNGDAEPDPADPLNPAANFRRGEILAESVADGAILARMVRTGTTSDAMAGMAGGRLFTVDRKITTTVERLKIGATALSASTIGSVVGSGDGLTVMDFLDAFAGSQIATALPSADGNMRLVSRASGKLQLRGGVVPGYKVGVQDSERGNKSKLQTWQGFIRLVRVTYGDALSGQSLTVDCPSPFDGGKVFPLDVSNIVWGAAAGRAIGQANICFFGNASPVLTETWADRTHGDTSSMPPAFYAEWQVGDLITFTAVSDAGSPATVTAYKLSSMKPGLEVRSVDVELLQLTAPVSSTPTGWVDPGWVDPGWVS
ncbi:MAG: hypothetical protein JSS67_03640 [Bacteroidetes bacterium]|nr:hypothetical protein [Bacteroidota bacterium]